MLQENCEFFEVIDWDTDTNEIIHAVCTDHNPNWPNCNMCQGKWEYADIKDDAVCGCCSSQAAMENGLCELCQEIKDEESKAEERNATYLSTLILTK